MIRQGQNTEIVRKFTDRFKKARTDAGYTEWGWQSRLARDLGVNQTTISHWEKGDFLPGFKSQEKLWVQFEKARAEKGKGEEQIGVRSPVEPYPSDVPALLSRLWAAWETIDDDGRTRLVELAEYIARRVK